MLDTNAFNRALDAAIDPASRSRRHRLFVTHVQKNELQATRKSERLDALLKVFETVDQEVVPTAAAVWDVSEWSGAEFGSAGGAYDSMLKSLNLRNRSKPNNARDALIGVTAFKRQLTLVTDDADLAAALVEHGGMVMKFSEFAAHAC